MTEVVVFNDGAVYELAQGVKVLEYRVRVLEAHLSHLDQHIEMLHNMIKALGGHVPGEERVDDERDADGHD